MPKRKKRKESNTPPIKVNDSFKLWLSAGSIWVVTASVIWLIVIEKSWLEEEEPLWGAILGLVLVLVFFALSFYAVTICGRTEISEETVTRINFYGCYQIRWDEVKWIDIHSSGHYTFHSLSGYLNCPGPNYWGGADKQQAVTLLFQEITKRKIKVHEIEGEGWFLKAGKNTRVD